MKDLYFLITIIRRSDTEEYETFYQREKITAIYETHCKGTAHARTLDLLGLEQTQKTMLFSLLTADNVKKILRELTLQMKIDLPDRGVAMAIPLSGIGGSRTLAYFTGEQEITEQQEEEENMKPISEHELIVAIYEKGYTDLVMDAARAAGAGGGTTVRAKGTGAGAEKFFGLSLAEEKEIVFIVSDTAHKKEIMKAIMQKAGMDSKAHAIVFSLPVSDTAGFRFADAFDKESE